MKKIYLVLSLPAVMLLACGAASQVPPPNAVDQQSFIQTSVAQTQTSQAFSQSFIQTTIAQTQAAWTPTQTRQPATMPTVKPTITLQSTAKGSHTYYDSHEKMDCIFWEDVTASMEGNYICVFGRVTSVFLQYNGMYFYFKDDGHSFYLILLKQGDQYYDFPAVQIDDCVQMVGTVKTFLGIPRIETGDRIHYWHSQSYTCDRP